MTRVEQFTFRSTQVIMKAIKEGESADMSQASKKHEGVYLVGGSTHPTLAQATADAMGYSLGGVEFREFPNTELYVRYTESIRGSHVIIIQSLAATEHASVNDALMELILMVDAAKRASACEITVVMPYMAYSRQDRKAKGREPISAAAVIKMLAGAGADRLVSVDMHSPQTQAVFNGPFDHLTAEGMIRMALHERIKDSKDTFVMVSPDGGRAKSSEHYAEQLGIDLVHMPKSRDRHDSSKITRPENIEGVDGKICILVDDMIDTAGTLVSATEALKRSNAKAVITASTHGLFSGPALERISQSTIDTLLVTDAVPLDRAKKALGDRLEILPLAPMLASALRAIVDDGSVSDIFHGRNYL